MWCLCGKGFSQTYLNMKKRLLLAISAPEVMVMSLAANTETVSMSGPGASFVDVHCLQWEH